MTEKEQRIAHNKAALQTALENCQRMYPGMIAGVEMTDDCMCGKGVLAVTDDVFDRLPHDLQYTPHIQNAVDKSGKETSAALPVLEEKVVPRKPLMQTRSIDLEELLG